MGSIYLFNMQLPKRSFSEAMFTYEVFHVKAFCTEIFKSRQK